MRFLGLAVSVYLIDDGYYIPSPVSALPTAAVVAADYIIIAVKADDSMEHIFITHAVEYDIIFARRGGLTRRTESLPSFRKGSMLMPRGSITTLPAAAISVSYDIEASILFLDESGGADNVKKIGGVFFGYLA